MLICPEFPPEPSSSGIMADQLSARLAIDGYNVTVVTAFPNRPAGRTYPGFRRRFRGIEQHGAVRVVRCASWLLGPKRRHFDRVLENLTFGLTSLWNALREPAPDLVIVETWPILAVQTNFWLGKLKNVPLVYYVKDVYPEISVDVGILGEDSLMARLLLAWDAHLCRAAVAVVAISETMKTLLCSSRHIPPEKVQVTRDWVDRNAIAPRPRQNDWRSRLGIPEDRFVLMYAGILGLVSGVDVLLEVARELKSSNLLILCIGEGPLKGQMMTAAAQQGLDNFRFLQFQSQQDLPNMLATADAFFLPMRPHTRDASVPSKLISYLAAGRPVICASPPDSAVLEVVRNGNAGIVVEPGNVDAIVHAVETLASRPPLAEELGRNARKSFEDLFTFERSYTGLERLVRAHLKNSAPQPAPAAFPEGAPVVEPMRVQDVPAVADIHLSAFAGFAARMGRRFLCASYRRLCSDSRYVAQVLKLRGQ